MFIVHDTKLIWRLTIPAQSEWLGSKVAVNHAVITWQGDEVSTYKACSSVTLSSWQYNSNINNKS